MKAIHLTAYGNPAQNLKMVEVAEPNLPSAGEALVRMEYAPVNHSDLLLANRVYFLNPKLPSVIGGEGAGIVEAVGSGVRGYPETFSHCRDAIKPHPGGNEMQGDHTGRAYSA